MTNHSDNSLAKALAKTATPRVLLVKSRGWWGPEHGGNHLKKLDALHGASVTSDLPSGGHTLPTLPSSVGIQDAVAARDYWQRHLANQTFTMSVAMKSGKYPMSLSFDSANTHMWTRAASPEESADAFDRPREKVGPRVFDAQRALLMDRLIPSLERPWKVLASHDRNLFLGARLPDGKTYVVVLRVVSRGVSHFVSAHPRDQAGINKLITALRPVVPAGHASGKKKPLRKAAVDLVSLNRLDEIVGFRDSQVASLTGSALAEPHCRALQAPARAIAANQGNLEPKSKPLTGLPASVSADPDENIAVKPSLRKSWVVVFPNGLAKSYVHGHYRKNPPSALARANPDGTGIRPLAGFNKKIVEMLATVNREKVSGVVDANGEPLIAYHGTGADISGFDDQGKSTQGEGLGTGLGHFFTNSPEYASDYAKMAQGNVIPSWLAIKKPLVITDREGMSAPVMIGDKAHKMLVEVRELQDKNRMYIHEVVLQKEVASVGEFISAATPESGNQPHGPHHGAIYSFVENLRKVNPSKVVDANGEPLVLYHGTKADFSMFNEATQGKNHGDESGFFFTSNPGNAGSGYADGEGGNVMPVSLSLKNPLVIKSDKFNSDRIFFADRAKIMASVRLGRNDGIIVEDREGNKTFVAFRPAQVKSAIGNTGTFRPDLAHLSKAWLRTPIFFRNARIH